LSGRIRAHRKQQKVNATSAAEAAGLSRVTLHRIERGEPSVAMGSYLSVTAALGLDLEVTGPKSHPLAARLPSAPSAPSRIRLGEYPQLKRLAWQLHGVDDLTPAEALSLYERNWRHVDHGAMEPHERALVRSLAASAGGGRLLV
jgi:transcriptional regulator with XRE-family HTH domain